MRRRHVLVAGFALGAIAALVMFGGSAFTPTADGSNSVPLGDTWLWKGQTWSQLNVQGPSPRSASVAAYDSARHAS